MDENELITKFVCPKCSNKVFKAITKIKTLNDFLGVVCAHCNYTITEADIRTQLENFADKIVTDAIGKSGMK